MLCKAVPTTEDALAARVLHATIEALEVYGIYLGKTLGLYAALHAAGPLSPPELAARAAIAPRYAREWLEQQAVAGLLEVETSSASAEDRRCALPTGHANVLVNEDHPAHLAPLSQMVAGIGGALDRVVAAYRTGDGVAYPHYGATFRAGQAGINRPAFLSDLVQRWIPALPDLHDGLRSTRLRVADVGCGVGWSTVAVAKAFPLAEVVGFDADADSVSDAHALAAARGVTVRFEVREAATLADRGPFDVVLVLEALHDMARPDEALRAVRAALTPGGSEHARFSPDGAWIVWGSGEGVEGHGPEATFWSEVNVMRVDGSERRRLTSSNADGHPESCGGCGSWPTTWSPDGTRVLFAQQMFPTGRQSDRMWRLDAARSLAPTPASRRASTERSPTPAPSAAAHGPPGEFPDKTLRVDGASRVYRLVVPPSASGRPAPLVVALHGMAIDNKDVMPRYTKLNDTARAHGFIVAYPNAVGGSWGIGPFKIRNDVALFDALVQDISAQYPLDSQRIYVVGMSNGGYFAQHLAKVRSAVVAAVATHSGQRGLDSLRINAASKYPVLIVHGVDDRVFSIEGARRNRDGYRREGHPVELVELPHTGHEWGTAHGVNETIWRFFEAHPKG